MDATELRCDPVPLAWTVPRARVCACAAAVVPTQVRGEPGLTVSAPRRVSEQAARGGKVGQGTR